MKKSERRPIYFLRFGKEDYPDIPSANGAINNYPLNLRKALSVSYYMPQPQYKNWVPYWLIRLITK